MSRSEEFGAGRTYKDKYFGEKTTTPEHRGDGMPASSVRRVAGGGVEAVNYTTGEIQKANSPKAAARKLFRQPTEKTNNRKEPKVKLNKKETKQAVENLRQDYNDFVVPYNRAKGEGNYTKSIWASEVNYDKGLKKTAIKNAKETKASRKNQKITGRGV